MLRFQGSNLARELRQSRLPRHRGFAARVAFEYMHAAADNRAPQPWARAALQPRRRIIRGS